MYTGSLRLRHQYSRRALYQAGRLLRCHRDDDHIYRLAGCHYSDDNCLLPADAYTEKAHGRRYSVSWSGVCKILL